MGYEIEVFQHDKYPCISIAGRQIGRGFAPFVIAEMSANHKWHIETALHIIEDIKRQVPMRLLQTYTPDTITLNCDTEEFHIHGGLWMGEHYTIYIARHTCLGIGMRHVFVTAKMGIYNLQLSFDRHTAVDLLED